MKLKLQLVFPGTCEEAFNLYKEALDGEIAFLFRKREDKSIEVSKEEGEKISHMVLKTKYFEIGGQDADRGEIINGGNNAKQVLVFTNMEELNNAFDLLSKDGEITTPLEKTFFSEAIGEVVDKFGIRWLIMMTDDDYSA
ncbi:VOC family protein [Dysgonomonas sp. HGC4]|uniref:VOC family protein n=1 Tax=Dysgonomonas sp. HGC4 TaxID=1658009 RepID=UPI000680075C|nr:VOC family protein [Dysgonomonas sp. HGC4]MBD8347616.1 VOC family protein [Dysgonomonas sp. HGC4]